MVTTLVLTKDSKFRNAYINYLSSVYSGFGIGSRLEDDDRCVLHMSSGEEFYFYFGDSPSIDKSTQYDSIQMQNGYKGISVSDLYQLVQNTKGKNFYMISNSFILRLASQENEYSLPKRKRIKADNITPLL